MATFYSKQRLDQLANPPVKMKPNELAGRVRAAYFSYTAPATGMPAAGDVIELTTIPAGARILRSFLAWDAAQTGATLSLGVQGAPGKYMAPQTMTSGGVAIGPGQPDDLEEPAGATVIGTLGTAGLVANGRIRGYVLYVVD